MLQWLGKDLNRKKIWTTVFHTLGMKPISYKNVVLNRSRLPNRLILQDNFSVSLPSQKSTCFPPANKCKPQAGHKKGRMRMTTVTWSGLIGRRLTGINLFTLRRSYLCTVRRLSCIHTGKNVMNIRRILSRHLTCHCILLWRQQTECKYVQTPKTPMSHLALLNMLNLRGMFWFPVVLGCGPIYAKCPDRLKNLLKVTFDIIVLFFFNLIDLSLLKIISSILKYTLHKNRLRFYTNLVQALSSNIGCGNQ